MSRAVRTPTGTSMEHWLVIARVGRSRVLQGPDLAMSRTEPR